jgi:riboflavin kinase/FMN adenylyltransferase
MTVSSSAIRHELERGNVEKGNAMLGHSFLIDGTVVDGQKIGRKMNFPTANVALKEPLKILPANGVYSAKIHVKGKDYDGMLNVGIRPTVDGRADDTTVECHIFDFDDNVYGEEINVYPLNFVREERKFESIEALAAQLQKDKEHVLRLLS